MVKLRILLQTWWVVSCCAPAALGQTIPAFPGADGAAANVTGGRGGTVYHVTLLDQNFNDNRPGTLRYGLDNANFQSGVPRTIVFDVAGTFWLGRFGAEQNHHNGWDTQSRINLPSNVTIAGQSAPGPVMIMGGVVKAGGINTIIRNVTIAPGYGMRNFEKPDEDPPVLPTPGDFPDSYTYDAIDISGQGIMIDHVTTIYATDETISMNELADDVTVQYSNISQGQNYPQADVEGGGRFTGHALGSLIQPGSAANISVHHNLYAHQKGRLPRVGTETSALSIPNVGGYNDFRNNVFYNWFGTAGQGGNGQPSQNNFINNFYLAGPGGDDPIGGSNPGIQNRSGGTGAFDGSFETKVFHSGNLRDTNKDGDADDTSAASYTGNIQANPFTQTPYTGVTDSATNAYARVLDYMGAAWWNRGAVDARLVNEVRTGTGKIVAWADDPFNDDPNEGTEWRNLLSYRADTTTGAAPFNHPADWDTDGDGIPNHWEENHGLPVDLPNNNGDFDNDGYSDLDEYLNEIAAWPAPQPLSLNGNSSSRYAEIANWDINWQPSRYDTAVIGNHAAAVVDAVGQHAGEVQIGTATLADTASLSITAGWLKVQNAGVGLSSGRVVIGDDNVAAAATLALSGGELFADQIDKSSGSTFDFTGGMLHANLVNFELQVAGGTVAPGESIGTTTVAGNANFAGGSSLQIELHGSIADQFIVAGDLNLGLDTALEVVELATPSQSSYLIAQYSGTLSGAFDSVSAGYTIDAETPGEIWLLVDPLGLPGDYNDDGIVNAADYAVWRDHLGQLFTMPGDTTPGSVDAEDYNVWRTNFGQALAAAAVIPEPTFAPLLAVASAVVSQCRLNTLRRVNEN